MQILKRGILPLIVFLALLSLCGWRAQPAFCRGTYSTEGGEWLSAQWIGGVSHALAHIRPDFWTVGNQAVIAISDGVTRLLFGHALAAQGPAVQHWMACAYVAALFLGIWLCLRPHHGRWVAFFVTLAMLAVPDLDGENRIFGEANNVGYFSVPAVFFLFYDLWQRPTWSFRRLAVVMLVAAFHIFTSPLAALVAASMCGLCAVRHFWQHRQWRPVLCLAGNAALSLYVIWHGSHYNVYAGLMEERLAEHPVEQRNIATTLKSRFAEMVLARQFLYPLTFPWHLEMSDKAAWLTFLGVLALLLWLGWKTRSPDRPKNVNELGGLFLAAGVVLSAGVATLMVRPWFMLRFDPYESVHPCRYYLAQNMMAAAVFALMAVRAIQLWPRLQPWSVAALTVYLCTALTSQRNAMETDLAQTDPAIAALHWGPQLARSVGISTLTGDLTDARARKTKNLTLDVPMSIPGFSLPVPVAMLESFKTVDSTTCPISSKTQHPLSLKDKKLSAKFQVAPPVFSGRHHGLLVELEATLTNAARFNQNKRRLWLSGLKPPHQAQAWVSSLPAAHETGLKPRENSLFHIALFFPAPVDEMAVRAALQGASLGLGAAPEDLLSATPVMESTTVPTWTSLVEEAGMAKKLHPRNSLWKWDTKVGGISGKNIAVTPGQPKISILSDTAFSEMDYLALHPEAASLVTAGKIASGEMHWTLLGKPADTPTFRRSVSLDLSGTSLRTKQVDGISVGLLFQRGNPKERIAVHFHGPQGELATLPISGQKNMAFVRFETDFLRDNWACPDFPIARVEIEFLSPFDYRTIRFEDLHLWDHAD